MIYMNNMNVALLFGGKSFEHDISIITTNVIYHAIKDKYNLILIYIDKEGTIRLIDKLDLEEITSKKKYPIIYFIKKGIRKRSRKTKIDVLINLIHGINGEDGLAASISNLYDIPYVGSNNISSAAMMDKYFTYAILSSLNINVIDTKQMFDDGFSNTIDFPALVKPARLGSSIGIAKINGNSELKDILELSFKFDNKVVVQPFINKFKEYNQAAYIYKGEIILSRVEEVFKSDEILSFDDKYISNTNRNHRIIDDENMIKDISNLTKKVYSELELSGVVRIDYMFFNDELYINEINTTPGSLAYYLFDEKLDDFIGKQIQNALLEFQNKRPTTFYTNVLEKKYSYKK